MTKAPLLQIIVEASTAGDTEELFINTVEAGARLMLEAADAVRDAGTKPDKERINIVIQNMTRVHGFCANAKRTLGNNLDLLASTIRFVEAGDIVDPFDEDEMFNRDRVLFTHKPTMFFFEGEGDDHEPRTDQ